MQRGPTSLILSETQLKTTMSYPLIPVAKVVIKTREATGVGEHVGEKRNLVHRWWEWKLVQLLWTTVWRVLKKLKIELPWDPAIALLGIYPKEMNSGFRRGICISMFTAALFTTAKIENHPKVYQQLRG